MGKDANTNTSTRPLLNGAQALVASLEAAGVRVVFGYPGGQALRIYDALYDCASIRHVLARHEQSAVHEADGYARASGEVGTVIVTSGPGATNTVTGIATAYMDSVPLVVITAQAPRGVIGTDSFQESDIYGISLPIVKHSYLVKEVSALPQIIAEAYHIASTGRPGPVLVDIPSDVLAEELRFSYPHAVNLPGYKPTYKGNARQIRSAVDRIVESKRPIIFAGGGVVASNASDALLRFAESLRIPVVTTLMAKGAFPENHPLHLGPVGMHGAKYANLAMTESDLLIAVGARFSDRVTGKLDEFAPRASLIHIDIDPAEIGKVREVQVPIVGDAWQVLEVLLSEFERRAELPETEEWLGTIEDWRSSYPLYRPGVDGLLDRIKPEYVMQTLSASLDPESSVVTTDVGQHQMWAAQYIARTRPRTFLSSGGLGTMGYGLPAAIGAAIARPDETVVCVSGDGGLQMCSHEMIVAKELSLPIKVLLVDNGCLGMVHQWQKYFCNERYSATEFLQAPDFIKLAEAYGWSAERIERHEEVDAAIERLLASPGPALLDVAISPYENVHPFVAPGRALDEQIGAVDAAVGAVDRSRSDDKEARS